MKKIAAICLMVMLLVTALPISADLIWTPLDEYLSSCDYSNEIRSFIAAGETGWAEAIDLPTAPSLVRKFPNGTEFLIDVFCGKDDNRWALIRNSRPPGSDEKLYPNECFIRMKDLVPGYDAAVFEEMHSDELRPFTEEFDFCSQASLEVRMTPDSPFVMYERDPGKFDGCREGNDFRNIHNIESVYVDGNGDRWVPIKNVYAKPDGWVNIDRHAVPENSN